MTRTVTLVVMEAPSQHDLSYDPDKQARRYRRGDIIDVFLTPPKATKTGNDWHLNSPIGNSRLVYIHMRDVPEDRWTNMRKEFRKGSKADNTEVSSADDVEVRRRKWRFRIPGLTAPKRQELEQERQLTLAWNAARNHIRRKVIVVEGDPDQDDTSNAVQDSDLPA